MDLEDRIKYWRGRAALATGLSLESEAAIARKIVAELVAHRAAQRKLDERVDRLAEQMPQELYTVEQGV